MNIGTEILEILLMHNIKLISVYETLKYDILELLKLLGEYHHKLNPKHTNLLISISHYRQNTIHFIYYPVFVGRYNNCFLV